MGNIRTAIVRQIQLLGLEKQTRISFLNCLLAGAFCLVVLETYIVVFKTCLYSAVSDSLADNNSSIPYLTQ